MKIEVLFVPNCPNHRVALERLREVLVCEGSQTRIREVLVADAATAQALKFPGSPTIRLNGHDVEPQGEHAASFGLTCRLYADGNAPSRERLRDAIRSARALEA